MTGKPYDLTVAYRIYPRVSKTPAIFADNKFKLSEFCLRSFKESLGPLRVKMLVLLDGCPPEYTELFQRYFAAEDLELIPLPGVGNLPTFGKQIDLLLEQNYSEAVYFAEDDYFYLPGQFPLMLDFLHSQPDAHFVTPYDHPDYYTSPAHSFKKEVRPFKNQNWRSEATTCLTFLTTKKILSATASTFRSYCRKNTDAGVWLAITRFRALNPFFAFTQALSQPAWVFYVWQAWRYCFRQVISGKTYRLWAPVPSLSTHMEKDLVAVGIDWPSIFSHATERMTSSKAPPANIETTS